ncbi:hypothetical protein IPA_03305 [Ignicoccus pacificus DSM 13166]|uniref:Uncharacterized protein n=1 Tax=Ignicoccus pacificus DSM 13166 TaxID=940294 RepID=A0A977KAZ0_9CREN|nr:hypothetical protein IPA_03305 [Ignicoccus pacificus DSM 13166]
MFLHTPVGFDERGPMHCMIAAQKKWGEINEIIAYIPKNQDDRGKVALENFRMIARGYSVVHEVEVPKEPKGIIKAALLIGRELEERVKKGINVICLSCGMRFIVLALYTAALSLRLEDQEKVWLFLEIESDPTSGTLLPLINISKFLMHVYMKDSLDRDIMRLLAFGEARLQDIYSTLKKEGHGYTKTTIQNRLKALVKDGLVVKDRTTGTYKLKEIAIEELEERSQGNSKES